MLTGWGASKARAGYTGGLWQDAVCYVRESLKDTKDQGALMENFKKFQNSCVDTQQLDLQESAYSEGNQSRELCLQACLAADACTGVEWYNAGWEGNRCYHINLGDDNATPAAAGSPADQFRDAVCYAKK
jgi:hypothetical protein